MIGISPNGPRPIEILGTATETEIIADKGSATTESGATEISGAATETERIADGRSATDDGTTDVVGRSGGRDPTAGSVSNGRRASESVTVTPEGFITIEGRAIGIRVGVIGGGRKTGEGSINPGGVANGPLGGVNVTSGTEDVSGPGASKNGARGLKGRPMAIVGSGGRPRFVGRPKDIKRPGSFERPKDIERPRSVGSAERSEARTECNSVRREGKGVARGCDGRPKDIKGSVGRTPRFVGRLGKIVGRPIAVGKPRRSETRSGIKSEGSMGVASGFEGRSKDMERSNDIEGSVGRTIGSVGRFRISEMSSGIRSEGIGGRTTGFVGKAGKFVGRPIPVGRLRISEMISESGGRTTGFAGRPGKFVGRLIPVGRPRISEMSSDTTLWGSGRPMAVGITRISETRLETRL
jgi:hypothetical protein